MARAEALGVPLRGGHLRAAPERLFFGGPGTIFRLTPLPEKERLLEALGLDGMIVLTFDKTMASLPAAAFVEDDIDPSARRQRIGRRLRLPFRQGARWHAGLSHRRRQGRTGFDVEIVPKVEHDADGPIVVASSTATRAALEQGDVLPAPTALLGHPYAIIGTVQKRAEARPHAGISDSEPRRRPELPPAPRHLRRACVGGRPQASTRWRAGDAAPPWRPDGRPLLEVFLFDYSGDLYGARHAGRLRRLPARRGEIRYAGGADGADARRRRGRQGWRWPASLDAFLSYPASPRTSRSRVLRSPRSLAISRSSISSWRTISRAHAERLAAQCTAGRRSGPISTSRSSVRPARADARGPPSRAASGRVSKYRNRG